MVAAGGRLKPLSLDQPSLETKQYVVFVAGGNAILKAQASDQVVAFALEGSGK